MQIFYALLAGLSGRAVFFLAETAAAGTADAGWHRRCGRRISRQRDFQVGRRLASLIPFTQRFAGCGRGFSQA